MVSVTLINDDCLNYMRTMPAGSVDCVVTDPPYGTNKAEWDTHFPTEWYSIAKQLSPRICIITGSIGLRDSLRLMGDDVIDIIAARNLNALTRGPLGFSNWLACALSGTKPPQMQNFFEFAIRGKMPDHPSPKPIEYMRKLIERVTSPGDTVLDPFAGSGTTGVACIETGRNFIGIELEQKYYEIMRRRTDEAQLQYPMELPEPPREKATQLEM